jgi:deoxyribodipyrimidine photo-lyase
LLLARVGRAMQPPEVRDGQTFFGCDLGPSEMTPADALHLATRGGADVLGRSDIGHLAVGVAPWPTPLSGSSATCGVHDHAPLAHAAQPARAVPVCDRAQPVGAARRRAAALRFSAREPARPGPQDLRAAEPSCKWPWARCPRCWRRLHALAPLRTLTSHEETGNGHTYARDQGRGPLVPQSRAWPGTSGPARRGAPPALARPVAPGAGRLSCTRPSCQPPHPAACGASLALARRALAPGAWPGAWKPRPTPAPAWRTLARLAGAARLFARAQPGYRGGISSPLTAPTACSRLSPYLALGCVACAKWCRPPSGASSN